MYRKASSSASAITLLLLILCLPLFTTCTGFRTVDLAEPLQQALQGNLKSASFSKLHNLESVRAFYKSRNYEPGWLSGKHPSDEGFELVQAVEAAAWHGLRPNWYHYDRLRELAREGKSRPLGTDALVEWDILASDSFVSFAADLARGRINPHTLDDNWGLERAKFNANEVLKEAVEGSGADEALQKISPGKDYEALRKALYSLVRQQNAGGWTQISPGRKLQPDESGPRVTQLKQRLGYPIFDDKYDGGLEERVKAFQASVGLNPDGVVGQTTLDALNVPVGGRIHQIEVNLERLRWLPRDTKDSFVFVDIANFRLSVLKEGNPELEMKVIVGEKDWETPVFSESISYLVVNPDWRVPTSIATQELLPQIQKHPEVLAKKHIDVFPASSPKGPPLDPGKIPWKSLSTEKFPYLLVQRPGRDNPLGSLKFMFPNQYGVYLHGTTGPGLFQRDVRSFSHGCIRVEKPWDLAEFLLKDNDKSWDRAALAQVAARGKTVEIPLKHPFPVHFSYRTAWVEDGEIIQFRKDIYGWDRLVAKALQRGEVPVLAD